MINPIIYRVSASLCGGLSILPLDVIQTKTLSTNNVKFKFRETKWLILLPVVFAIQNSVFDNITFINNKSIKGAIAGLISSPFFIFTEIKKYQSRLGILPKYKIFVFWITLRQTIVFLTLYTFIIKNAIKSNFYAALLANLIGFPFKLLSMKNSYDNIKLDFNSIKYSAFIEITKSAIGDGITLFLIYNFKYSPLKKLNDF
uniref:Uncharacterized protein n=1 Tax=viral metagenome TaxID=1070528 RepID=A0A6C0AYU1_9ZZZZ|tara:strand:- start:512 stop:1114 length:603 start_codon:yes stop_codon:yes gene_type:complete